MIDPFSALEKLSQRPNQRVVMRQSWRNLLFLHVAVEPELVQKLLPNGLTVETYDGKAWIGFVIFQMQNIRFAGTPAIPGFSAFPETNVRTYVVDKSGIPGVWFFSLDASNLTACLFARRAFNLNYIWAKMSLRHQNGTFQASGTRKHSPNIAYQASWKTAGNPAPSAKESFDYWLVERYLLFAEKDGKIFSGRVHHPPYQIQDVQNLTVQQNLIPIPGYEHTEIWDHITFSPGVDVEVFGLKPV